MGRRALWTHASSLLMGEILYVTRLVCLDLLHWTHIQTLGLALWGRLVSPVAGPVRTRLTHTTPLPNSFRRTGHACHTCGQHVPIVLGSLFEYMIDKHSHTKSTQSAHNCRLRHHFSGENMALMEALEICETPIATSTMLITETPHYMSTAMTSSIEVHFRKYHPDTSSFDGKEEACITIKHETWASS